MFSIDGLIYTHNNTSMYSSDARLTLDPLTDAHAEGFGDTHIREMDIVPHMLSILETHMHTHAHTPKVDTACGTLQGTA